MVIQCSADGRTSPTCWKRVYIHGEVVSPKEVGGKRYFYLYGCMTIFFLTECHEYLTPLTFDPLTLRKTDHLLLKVVFWCKVRLLWEDKCYVYSA